MNQRFRPLLTIVATLTLCGLPVRLQAQSIPVPARYAQERAVTVKVWPGFGINISFLPAKASIVKVWLDDPSKVVLDFDEPLCLAAEQTNCESGRPSIIHLRRIQGLTFPHLPSADSTLLTAVVETISGERQIYTFRIELAAGEPEYHTLAISPEPSTQPAIQVGSRQANLEAVELGLQVAASRQLIERERLLWRKIQTFLALARNGVAVSEAAQQAGVSLAVITRLAGWGLRAADRPENRPENRSVLLPTTAEPQAFNRLENAPRHRSVLLPAAAEILAADRLETHSVLLPAAAEILARPTDPTLLSFPSRSVPSAAAPPSRSQDDDSY